MPPVARQCNRCGCDFAPRLPEQRYCSRRCGQKASRGHGPRPATRKVERPPYGRLLREIAELGYSAVGRRYGVSDNAVRKWVKLYEQEIERERGDAAQTSSGSG
jgi:hypothetical protein